MSEVGHPVSSKCLTLHHGANLAGTPERSTKMVFPTDRAGCVLKREIRSRGNGSMDIPSNSWKIEEGLRKDSVQT